MIQKHHEHKKYRLNEMATINRPSIEQHVLTKKLQGEKWFQVTLSTWPLNRHTRWLSCGFLQSYSTADLQEKKDRKLREKKKSRQNTFMFVLLLASTEVHVNYNSKIKMKTTALLSLPTQKQMKISQISTSFLHILQSFILVTNSRSV